MSKVVEPPHLAADLKELQLPTILNRHHHREIGATPEHKLANRLPSRQVSIQDLERAFLLSIEARSDDKTGEVHLPNGSFRVPSAEHAGQRSRFLYHPTHEGRAALVMRDGREIELQPFTRKPLATVPVRSARRETSGGPGKRKTPPAGRWASDEIARYFRRP